MNLKMHLKVICSSRIQSPTIVFIHVQRQVFDLRKRQDRSASKYMSEVLIYDKEWQL